MCCRVLAPALDRELIACLGVRSFSDNFRLLRSGVGLQLGPLDKLVRLAKHRSLTLHRQDSLLCDVVSC